MCWPWLVLQVEYCGPRLVLNKPQSWPSCIFEKPPQGCNTTSSWVDSWPRPLPDTDVGDELGIEVEPGGAGEEPRVGEPGPGEPAQGRQGSPPLPDGGKLNLVF